MGGLVPAIHALAGIPATGRHSAFFRTLLALLQGLRERCDRVAQAAGFDAEQKNLVMTRSTGAARFL
jgi:hypothetical protein